MLHSGTVVITLLLTCLVPATKMRPRKLKGGFIEMLGRLEGLSEWAQERLNRTIALNTNNPHKVRVAMSEFIKELSPVEKKLVSAAIKQFLQKSSKHAQFSNTDANSTIEERIPHNKVEEKNNTESLINQTSNSY